MDLKPETLSTLSDIALHYGPFFFAVLFVLVVSRWAYGVFKDTAGKKDPPATRGEVTTARVVFLGTFFFGLLLVVVSVTWWVFFQPKIYAFQGEITDLHDYETLASASNNLYFRVEPKESIDDIPLRNEHFIAVQSTPLTKGQCFDLEFSKNRSTRNKFQVAYDPADPYPKFHVDWDDSLHTNVLRREKAPQAARSIFVWTVHAAQIAAQVYQGKPPRSQMAQRSDTPAAVLQDSGSDVGSKIIALDSINNAPSTAVTEPAATGQEPILATLLDLTRHSDKEVSYKASVAVHKINLDEYVLQKLNSQEKRDRDEGQQILVKMDPADSARVLAKLSPAKSAALRLKTGQAAESQVIATASPQGDRYYVRATWDTKNSAAVDCLTNLFHAELLGGSNRTIEQEHALMTRGQRVVYWYDKEWTIAMVQKIRNCGGTATFVQAGVKK